MPKCTSGLGLYIYGSHLDLNHQPLILLTCRSIKMPTKKTCFKVSIAHSFHNSIMTGFFLKRSASTKNLTLSSLPFIIVAFCAAPLHGAVDDVCRIYNLYVTYYYHLFHITGVRSIPISKAYHVHIDISL